jgi:hypothetical protein
MDEWLYIEFVVIFNWIAFILIFSYWNLCIAWYARGLGQIQCGNGYQTICNWLGIALVDLESESTREGRFVFNREVEQTIARIQLNLVFRDKTKGFWTTWTVHFTNKRELRWVDVGTVGLEPITANIPAFWQPTCGPHETSCGPQVILACEPHETSCGSQVRHPEHYLTCALGRFYHQSSTACYCF